METDTLSYHDSRDAQEKDALRALVIRIDHLIDLLTGQEEIAPRPHQLCMLGEAMHHLASVACEHYEALLHTRAQLASTQEECEQLHLELSALQARLAVGRQANGRRGTPALEGQLAMPFGGSA